MVRTLRIIGGAGTGKTTELVRLMLLNIERGNCDPYSVGFVSFTRAARQEAAARAGAAFGERPEDLERLGWFRTLHSVCYRQLGAGKELLAETKADREWIEAATGESGTGRDGAETGTIARGTALGFSLGCWDVARATGEPLREVVERQRFLGVESVAFIVGKYEQAKRLDGRCDFTDLLGRFAGVRFGTEGWETARPEGEPPDLPVVLLDESQDQSALSDRVAQRIVERAHFAYVVGDPFQCQPAGTMVRTVDGEKPIESLDPRTDKIIAFNKRDGRFYGFQKRVEFRIASRTVDSSDICEIELEDGSLLRSTWNHKWLTRTRRNGQFATYLMRRGTRWRIGTVQLFANGSPETNAKNGDFRAKMRMNQEDADSLWILKVFDSDREARAYEQVASCRFGIPQVTFRPPGGDRTNLDSGFIDYVFSSLGDLTEAGLRCLCSHGLHEEIPHCVKGDRNKNGDKACGVTFAANILPEITMLPRFVKADDGRATRRNGVVRRDEMKSRRHVASQVEWVGVKSVRRLPPGDPTVVYSLDVEKHETYVADGFVTHNSIYGFAGSHSRHFMGWDVEDQKILGRSFRCPSRILAAGERCLSRCGDYWDRGIAPREDGGDVLRWRWQDYWEDEIDPRRPTLLLARTNFQAGRMRKALDERQIPWQPVDESNGGWRAPSRNAGTLALWKLSQGQSIGPIEWGHVLKILPAKLDSTELFARGTKAHWGDVPIPPEERRTLGDLHLWGATDALQWRIADGKWSHLVQHADRFVAAMERWGEAVATDPPVRVGTIHAAKGMEADDVLVLTTTSRIVEEGGDPDEERRLGYVAVTRARERCVLLTEGADCRMRELEDAA